MLNSVQAAQAPHVFIYNRWEVRTHGNPLAHCIVRGAINKNGQSIPNYHYEDLVLLAELYAKRSLSNPAVIVDTNHANSGKMFKEQPRIVMEVMRSIAHAKVLRTLIRGFMIESYLVEGSQPSSGGVFGKSITDPCLGWDDSRKLLLRLAESLDRAGGGPMEVTVGKLSDEVRKRAIFQWPIWEKGESHDWT
jgi:3-deoxy-7-phosphoheptulonate synthase